MKLNNKGFTLVEVLAVVTILTILGGVAITNILSSINTSKDASYKIMINDIVTASKTLYEEVNFGIPIKEYTTEGNQETDITISTDNTITTNIQTLVSNGYLNGTDRCNQKIKNNEENIETEKKCIISDEENSNTKVVINPKTKKDIGSCKITIKKEENGTYTVTTTSPDSKCPSEADYTNYAKGVK